MAIKTTAEIKAFFETGDIPTQQNFADMIDTLQPEISTEVVGSFNGVNRLFVTTKYIKPNTQAIYQDGFKCYSPADFTLIDNSVIVFKEAPQADDTMEFSYVAIGEATPPTVFPISTGKIGLTLQVGNTI